MATNPFLAVVKLTAKIYSLEVVGMKVGGLGLSRLRIILERKRINSKINSSGAEIVSS
jgi:hypothetical protein